MTKKKDVILFIISVSLILIWGNLRHITVEQYIYDSADYFEASRSFTSSGYFSWNNYSCTYRGYAFPFILYIYSSVGHLLGLPEWEAILIGNTLWISFIFLIVIPNVLKKYLNKNKNMILNILPLLIFMLFWQDLVFYPLTDIYSFGFVMMALFLTQNIKTDKKILPYILCLIIGMFLYLAYNIRTIYIFSTIIYLLVFLFNCIIREKKTLKNVLIIFLSILMGFLISAYPQYKININQHNVKAINVITSDLNGGELFTSHLYMGFLFDRYETYIGPSEDYPCVPMNFLDKAGIQIISNERINGFDSLLDYIKIVLKHPIDYMGVIVRHIMSAMYFPWNHAYITNITDHKLIYTMINYIILFLFGMLLYVHINSYGWHFLKDKDVWYIFAALFPCIAILFGAIEMRFFMPIYTIIYFYICMGKHQNFKSFILTQKKKILLWLLAIFIILIGYWGNIMGSAQNLPLLLK